MGGWGGAVTYLLYDRKCDDKCNYYSQIHQNDICTFSDVMVLKTIAA